MNNGIRLNLVVIRCSRIENAAEFYSRLGLQFIRHQHGGGPEHFSAELGDGVFELYPLSAEGLSTAGTRIGFSVSSIDEALAAVKDYPEAILSPPKDSPWGRRAVLSDPDGHRIELVQK